MTRSGITRLGFLISDILAGQTVECSEREMHRICRDLASMVPPRHVRAIRWADGQYRVKMMGAEVRR